MIKIYKRWKQRRKVEAVKKELSDLSWNMQFDELSDEEIRNHNDNISKIRLLLNIEEGLLESYY